MRVLWQHAMLAYIVVPSDTTMLQSSLFSAVLMCQHGKPATERPSAWLTTQVTVVCLAALASGKMHCLLDAKRCEEAGEGGAAQALLPLAGARPGALAHRTLSANPTVRVSCKTAAHMAAHCRIPRLGALVLGS